MLARWRTRAFLLGAMLVALVLLAVACGNAASSGATGPAGATATPTQATQDGSRKVPAASPTTGQGSISPSVLSVKQPAIQISPDHGRGGTETMVTGEGFPAGSEVQVRLGGLNTGATEDAYVSGKAGSDGKIELTLTMPDHWPNGDPINLPTVVILAATPDYLSKATALFTYENNAAPETPQDMSPFLKRPR